MSDFGETWTLVRKRFDDSVVGLTDEQLNWRSHPGVLSAGEMALHVVGVEVSFCTQLQGRAPEGLEVRLKQSATAGVVNDLVFPFEQSEITVDLVQEALGLGRALVEPMITNPDPWRGCTIVSALGPVIDGTGAFARLAYHPGYHQGQVHTLVTAPGFPK